ncbi:opioid growth factor receptor conserved domain-containing protein [Xylaria venustula]|nr:opioid growth factor receptor conserved domain-containing protein [Xylaria venustula]
MSSRTAKDADALRPQTILDFYDPIVKGKDFFGRTLDDILGWSDHQLEYSLDYMQILFPLPERSDPVNVAGYIPPGPVLDPLTIARFRGSVGHKKNLIRSVRRMLAFYGFTTDYKVGSELNLQIRPAIITEDRQNGFQRWATPKSQNHLRLTHILRCLSLLGVTYVAGDLYDSLIRFGTYTGRVNPVRPPFGFDVIQQWQRALRKPLIHHTRNETNCHLEWIEEYLD